MKALIYNNMRVNHIKDKRLNDILDKISNGIQLSKNDNAFLIKYNDILDSEIIEASHISKDMAFQKVNSLINSGNIVICGLYDADGILDDRIVKITHIDGECSIEMMRNRSIKLHDRFLYNIRYDFNLDLYRLESQDEYFEKILNI